MIEYYVISIEIITIQIEPRSWWCDFSFPSRYNNEYPSHNNCSPGSQRGITDDWLCLTSMLPVI